MRKTMIFKGFVVFILIFSAIMIQPMFASESAVPLTDKDQSLIDHQATVLSIEGTAQILKKSFPSWQELKAGARVDQGDQIKTSENSAVNIQYDLFMQNHCRISANTIAEFKSIEPTQVNLVDGTIFNMLNGLPAGSPYEVTSPTVVASVRGTVFVSSYNPVKSTESFSVAEGEVRVYPLKEDHLTPQKTRGVSVRKLETIEVDFSNPEKGISINAPRIMDPSEVLLIQEMQDALQAEIEKHSGGEATLHALKEEWQLTKNDLQKMEAIRSALTQEGTPLMFPQQGSGSAENDLKKSASDSDLVRVSGMILKDKQEEEIQESMINAVESNLEGKK